MTSKTGAPDGDQIVEPDPSVSIRLLSDASEFRHMSVLFQQVWGTPEPVVAAELLRAISHAGGYVAGAFDGPNLLGASFGFLGRHRGEESLHSHITGLLPGVQRGGIGRAMKLHQRDWAAERGIPWITWTFDPLVRRNAWFNIAVLGAGVAEYLVDFYGSMTDSINTDDESDRLVVAWPATDAAQPLEPPASAKQVLVPTPEDIVALRRTDPAEAQRWRQRVRSEIGDRLSAGATITGFTRDGEYQLAVPS